MTVSTMAMALNVGIGFTIWMSVLPLVAQIILTVILIAKMLLFYVTAWMGGNDKIRKGGASALIALNIGITVYAIIYQAYFVAFATAATLVMLCVWSFAAIFDFKGQEKK